ncbi:MAG: hypothetical protein HYT16_02970 [DPANN group archaeon]|nr:hypothetical protein [DPANN group archaeon]
MGNAEAMFGYRQSEAVRTLDAFIKQNGTSAPKDASLASTIFISLMQIADSGFAQIPKEKVERYKHVACALANFYYSTSKAEYFSGIDNDLLPGLALAERAAKVAKADKLAGAFNLVKANNSAKAANGPPKA